MSKRSAANIPTSSVWLSDVDVQLIQTIAIHKYMSALDVAYYHFEPTSHTYVRARLSRLAGGDDHCPNQYLIRFNPPHTNTGRSEKVFAVGPKGWELLAEIQADAAVASRSVPSRVSKLSYGFVQHALLLSRFIAFAKYWSRQQEAYTLVNCQLSYELAGHRALTTMILQGKTVSVIPDAFLCFERVANGNRFYIIFEADCGTESGKKFRNHISNRLVYLQSPQYKALAKTDVGRVCYLTIGQVPRYKESRRRAMQRITHDVLAELKMPEWSSVFLFASVDYKCLYQSELLDQSEWYHPNAQTPVFLLPPVAGDGKE